MAFTVSQKRKLMEINSFYPLCQVQKGTVFMITNTSTVEGVVMAVRESEVASQVLGRAENVTMYIFRLLCLQSVENGSNAILGADWCSMQVKFRQLLHGFISVLDRYDIE